MRLGARVVPAEKTRRSVHGKLKRFMELATIAKAVVPDFPAPSEDRRRVPREPAGADLRVFLFGELVGEPVDHPVIRPSINAVAETYDLAVRNPSSARRSRPTPASASTASCTWRAAPQDLVLQNKMQRRLGQLTGTCFQRCVGMDAINALHSVTFEIDEQHGTPYHARFISFVTAMQQRGFVIGGAMTDVKGDRGKAPHEQADPGPLRARQPAHGRGRLPEGRQGPPDRLHQRALAAGHADHAPRQGRQGLRHRRRRAGGCRRHHLHLWPPVLRHAQHGGRRDRSGQQAVRRPGSDDRLRRRLRALGERLHGWRGGVRRHARRALHHLSPAQLRLQDPGWATC